MRIEQGVNYAVVTGDLIGSTKMPLDIRRDFCRFVEATSTEMRRFLGTDQLSEIDVFSGDSWQFVSSPRHSLRACLFLRASIRAQMKSGDTRCAIGVGTIDFMPQDRVSQGDGQAFRLSGRLLERTKKKGPSMAIDAADPAIADQWDLLLALADAVIVSSWTGRRALAVTGELRGWSQEETGQLWKQFKSKPLSQASVSRYLEQANWPVFDRLLHEFEGFWE
jgi:hypothetical protein